MSVKLWQ